MKMIKYLFSMSLMLAVFSTQALAVTDTSIVTTGDFSDLFANDLHPHIEAIDYNLQTGIFKGYPDGTFKPDYAINRAELTKIVIEANYDDATITGCDVNIITFSDVPKTEWYAPYLCIALENGIIKGYSDGTFKPAQQVNFVEAAKIITNSFGVLLEDGTDQWYLPYVDYLETQQAIPVQIPMLTHVMTRGNSAEIIYRLDAGVDNYLSHDLWDLENPSYFDDTMWEYFLIAPDWFGLDNIALSEDERQANVLVHDEDNMYIRYFSEGGVGHYLEDVEIAIAAFEVDNGPDIVAKEVDSLGLPVDLSHQGIMRLVDFYHNVNGMWIPAEYTFPGHAYTAEMTRIAEQELGLTDTHDYIDSFELPQFGTTSKVYIYNLVTGEKIHVMNVPYSNGRFELDPLY